MPTKGAFQGSDERSCAALAPAGETPAPQAPRRKRPGVSLDQLCGSDGKPSFRTTQNIGMPVAMTELVHLVADDPMLVVALPYRDDVEPAPHDEILPIRPRNDADETPTIVSTRFGDEAMDRAASGSDPAQGDASSPDLPDIDPDLIRIFEAWPDLPPRARAAVMGVIEAAT